MICFYIDIGNKSYTTTQESRLHAHSLVDYMNQIIFA